MLTGLFFVILGVVIVAYPQVLVAMISTLLILFGLGMMAAAWQFRRMKRQSKSAFMNWVVRY